MKSLKKILSIFAAFMMVVGLTMTSASAESSTNGSITINNAVKNETYAAYKIFDAQYVNDEDGKTTSVSYTASTSVKEWFLAENNPAKDYFKFNAIGNSQVWNVVTKNLNADQGRVLADALRAEIAKTNGVFGNAQGTAGAWTAKEGSETEGSVTISGLDSGYYYVTSTQGTLVTINTATPNVSVEDKNTANVPSKPDKTIDSTTQDAYAQIGEVIPFKVTLTAKDGALNYKLVDTMTSGLSLITSGTENIPAIEIPSKSISYNYNNNVGTFTDGTKTVATLSTAPSTNPQGTTLTISFDNGYMKELTDNSTNGVGITVKYSATVTSEAARKDHDTNTVKLEYGNNQSTDSETVDVYKGNLKVFKWTGINDENGALAGAEFQIYPVNNGTTSSTPISVKKVGTVDGTYAVSVTSTENTETTVVSGTDGYIYVSGLEDGTYVLKETKAPDGYNLSTSEYSFTISSATDANSNTGLTLETNVENKSGTTLPSTGGMGTTMIYIAGAILMVGAAIIFVTNKRMKHE